MPVEVTPAVSDDGEITYRSFERLRLEKSIALPRAVVAALDRDRIYTLYGVFGHHDGAPVEYVVHGVRYDKLAESFAGAHVKPTLYLVSTMIGGRRRGVTSRSSAGA